jgi:hypothetical protein
MVRVPPKLGGIALLYSDSGRLSVVDLGGWLISVDLSGRLIALRGWLVYIINRWLNARVSLGWRLVVYFRWLGYDALLWHIDLLADLLRDIVGVCQRWFRNIHV